jgi:hypothetical protein
MRLVLAVGCVLLAGCSSSSPAQDADAGVDAASGPQPLGMPCDPAIAVPCLPTGDDCLGVECDPVAHTCNEYVTDAGATCSSGTAPCATTAGCELGLTCGFIVGAGCGAQGICINPPLPCQDDAGACGGAGTVCGCDGQPVSVLIPGYAAGPTPIGGACGPDGGAALDAAASDGSPEE